MSWLFSQALVEDCLRPAYLGIESFAQLKKMNIVKEFSYKGKMIGYCLRSRFGMTLEHSEVTFLKDVLTSCLLGFLVKPTALQQVEETTQIETCGHTVLEWFKNPLLLLSSGKMSIRELLKGPVQISDLWVTKQKGLSSPPLTWVQITYGEDIGFLHTPTTVGNYCCESMQKHPNCRLFKTVFGEVTPEIQEWLMGWHLKWTELEPLETDKFQLWLSKHLES